jgi:phytoene synthase
VYKPYFYLVESDVETTTCYCSHSILPGGFALQSTLDQAYRECMRLTRREAKNFYYAIVTLKRPQRRAICAIYSFCRVVDDAADLAPSPAVGREELRKLRSRLNACMTGRAVDAIFIALADVIDQYGISGKLLHAVIDGVEQDLTVKRYATFTQLRDYCWKVASAVGLLVIQVLGYQDKQAVRYAEDMGIALQLTNILRDVREDLEMGRIYLPQEELAEYGLTVADLEAGVVTEQWRRFMQFQVRRARDYYTSGSRLNALVPHHSLPCILVLQTVYSQLLGRIEALDYDVFSQRVSLSHCQKLKILFGMWLQWTHTKWAD